MFGITFRNTLKNLLRSPTCIFCLAVVLIVAVYSVFQGMYGYYLPELKEIIYDTDPRYVLDYKTAVQHVTNALSEILAYSIPIYTVICTAVILTRDYGDGFYEIEHSYGINRLAYLCGRLCALCCCLFAVTFAVYAFSYYLFVFTRGGIEGMTTAQLILDSVPRIVRMAYAKGLTNVMFYVCLTYMVGALCKSGIVAAAGGMVYAIFCYMSELLLSATLKKIGATAFFDWFHPLPQKLSDYLYYYDTEWFDELYTARGASLSSALACIGFLAGTALVCAVIAYLCIRKRNI